MGISSYTNEKNIKMPSFTYDKSESLEMSTKRMASFSSIHQYLVDTGKIPGILSVVLRHGKIAHCSVQGYACVEKNLPLQHDAIFRLYSMTKPITAAAVMTLYDDGCLDLDALVARYLPEFTRMQVYTKTGLVDVERSITIKQLLTHTAGLSYQFYTDDHYPYDPVAQAYEDGGLADGRVRLSSLTTAQYVEKLASLPLYAQPGTQWRYSEAMSVLGRLVEAVSGQRYSEFLRSRLFEPLGMTDTGFYVPKEKAPRLASLYVVSQDGGILPVENAPLPFGSLDSDYTIQPTFESGGGGLVGTAGDYLRFAQMLLNNGELDGARILRPSSVQMITSNHLGSKFGDKPLASLDHPLLNKEGLGFGFCGFVVNDAKAWGVGSNGIYAWAGAAGTFFWIDPEKDLVGLLMTQLVPDYAYPLPQQMLQMTYDALVG